MSRRPANRNRNCPAEKVWVGVGGGAGNLRDSYGNAARRFGRTRRWAPAPNETLSPMLAAQLAKRDGFA